MKKQPPIKLVEDRTEYTDSLVRQAEIDEHIATFLRRGGQIIKLETDATGLDRSGKMAEPFVIKSHVLPRKKSKQNWKDGQLKGWRAKGKIEEDLE
jgi:hypothetical protein